MRRHLKHGAGIDLEQICGVFTGHGNIVGAGVLQRSLHIVHGQNGRFAQHARLAVFFQSVDARQKIIRPVRVKSGEGKTCVGSRAGRGKHSLRRAAAAAAATAHIVAETP